MDIRVLRYFLAVAREGNITRASESLHIAQPSLSKQLMELEKELGKQLLIRGKRKITLTEEGVLLRKRADEIISLVEKAEREITSGFGEISGELYIGGNISSTVLRTASTLRKKYPEIQFHFYSGDATDVMERLEHGNLDFAVILQPVDTSKYDFVSLPECSEWGVLMKNNDILAKEDFITRKMIKDMPLILHQRIGLQEEIAHWAQESLQDLNVVATHNVVHGSPISFVKQDLGYFLTTRDLLASHLDKDFCFKTLKPQLKVKYAIVWKKHSVFSKVSNAFLSKLKQIIEN